MRAPKLHSHTGYNLLVKWHRAKVFRWALEGFLSLAMMSVAMMIVLLFLSLGAAILRRLGL
jgi:hypothetical protein